MAANIHIPQACPRLIMMPPKLKTSDTPIMSIIDWPALSGSFGKYASTIVPAVMARENMPMKIGVRKDSR